LTTIGLIVLSFLLSLACVWVFRKASAGHPRLLDIPNERSSHSVPVTRGAGLAIVLTVLGSYIGWFGNSTNLAYVVAAVTIAIVSFLDDLFSVPLILRLIVHFAAAGILLYFSGSYGEIFGVHFGPLAPWVTVVFIVWTINAFNFMDGIDGIAGSQAIGASLGWMILGVSAGIPAYSNLGAILLGASAGFLVFNWQPAKIFMGDVGSTFLGFTFAAFPLINSSDSQTANVSGLTTAIIFLWLFLFDTVFTRFWQIVRLTPFWRPHRDHLYQRLTLGGESHQKVALFFGMVAIGSAILFNTVGMIGWLPLALLLLASAVGLTAWARKKRLT